MGPKGGGQPVELLPECEGYLVPVGEPVPARDS